MLYFTADARDGVSGATGGVCNTCCCAAFTMRPGETNLLQINYAPWSVPLGGRGLTEGTNYKATKNTDGCATGDVAGFAPPTNEHISLTAVTGVPEVFDMLPSALPTGNSFTFELIDLVGGFSHGDATLTSAGVLTYNATAGFVGYDVGYYRMTDGQGRVFQGFIGISVNGGAIGSTENNYRDTSFVPYIDPSRIIVNKAQHFVQLPIYMPAIALPCEVYRLEIQQTAMDCNNNVFTHYSCYDISAGNC